MLAAHLDLFDAINLLIENGADVNLKTQNKYRLNDISYGREIDVYFERGERTALMYAAENASFDVIKLLIDNGANLQDRDSKGNGILYYLNLNLNISEGDYKRTVKLVKAGK